MMKERLPTKREKSSLFSEMDPGCWRTPCKFGGVILTGKEVQIFVTNQREIQAEGYEEFIEASNDGFWDWNIATGDVYFSRRWCEMLGYTQAEVAPHVRAWETILHPADRAHVMEVLTAHLEGRIPVYETEHRVKMKNGDWKWILDRGRVIERDSRGTPLRAVGAHVDISDRKRLDEEREQRARDFEQFSVLISHELRSPLSAIQMSLDLLARTRSVSDSVLRSMQESIERMKRLVSDLLDSGRIGGGEFHVELAWFPIQRLKQYLDSSLAREGEARRIEIIWSLDPTIDTVWGDECRLSQLLWNLIHNALKFAPPRSEVRVEVSRSSSGGLRFEVLDQGRGVPDEGREQIFEKFAQLRAHRLQGSGLGLFISRGIAEAHGGKLWVENRAPTGARFILELPSRAAAVSAA